MTGRAKAGAERRGAAAGRPSAVALGGGHGLHASLSALLELDVDVTAIVTVADDGGSSGRIRRELEVLPPGDLRMAMAALSDASLKPGTSGLRWDELLQHRLGGSGPLAGHAIGNLLMTALFELTDDPVMALDLLGGVVGARGRVLPMAAIPLALSAEIDNLDPDDPVRSQVVHGQHAIAASRGRVRTVELIPPAPPACPEAVRAIQDAAVVVLGPGSWFTSVLPHLLVPELAAALSTTSAQIVVVLNLEPEVGETDGFTAIDLLAVLLVQCPALTISAVIADPYAVADPIALAGYVRDIDARLLTAPVAESAGIARHDPGRLATAIAAAVGLDRPGGCTTESPTSVGSAPQVAPAALANTAQAPFNGKLGVH